jgi:hypothetical protein
VRADLLRRALPRVLGASFMQLAATAALATLAVAIVAHLFGDEPLAESLAVASFAFAFASAVLPGGFGPSDAARIFLKGTRRRT